MTNGKPSRLVDGCCASPYASIEMSKARLSEYRALASFRYEIRKFLAFSEAAAMLIDEDIFAVRFGIDEQ